MLHGRTLRARQGRPCGFQAAASGQLTSHWRPQGCCPCGELAGPHFAAGGHLSGTNSKRTWYRLRRFVIALDCGPISNPDGLRNQTEGGILQGMSRALVEEVTWDTRRVTSVDWETYKSLHLDYEMPSVETVFVTPAKVPATGAGETAITVTPAAIGNALFDATGGRLRTLPFTPERVKAALLSAQSAERAHI